VLEIAIEAGQHGDVVGRAIAAVADALALVAEAFFHLPGELGAVDELNLAGALGGLRLVTIQT
jgi:hypothetical protein